MSSRYVEASEVLEHLEDELQAARAEAAAAVDRAEAVAELRSRALALASVRRDRRRRQAPLTMEEVLAGDGSELDRARGLALARRITGDPTLGPPPDEEASHAA